MNLDSIWQHSTRSQRPQNPHYPDPHNVTIRIKKRGNVFFWVRLCDPTSAGWLLPTFGSDRWE